VACMWELLFSFLVYNDETSDICDYNCSACSLMMDDVERLKWWWGWGGFRYYGECAGSDFNKTSCWYSVVYQKISWQYDYNSYLLLIKNLFYFYSNYYYV